MAEATTVRMSDMAIGDRYIAGGDEWEVATRPERASQWCFAFNVRRVSDGLYTRVVVDYATTVEQVPAPASEREGTS